MKPQFKLVDGERIPSGIEWCHYTWNPLGGCEHGCRWDMPDGKQAICYAETTAHGIASAAYPQGFDAVYWRPNILRAPLKVKTPSRIFVGSMTDVGGHWQKSEHIEAILQVCREAHWHTFQLLTKNPLRFKQFDLPPNVWLGASCPPDHMWGRALTLSQKKRMFHRTLDALQEIEAAVKWISFEPLSQDWAEEAAAWSSGSLPFQWAVIGAASNGRDRYAPDEQYVKNMVDLLDSQGIRVFYKGNMDSLSWAKNNWRAEFPD